MFGEFQRRLNIQSDNVWHGLKLFTNIGENECSYIISEVHDQLLGENAREHSFLFEELLALIAQRDKGFTYNIWKNDQGLIIGACWMTSFMIANAERNGTFISFDMCKRKLNVANRPYAAITARDEFGSVCVLIESILVEEKFFSNVSQQKSH